MSGSVFQTRPFRPDGWVEWSQLPLLIGGLLAAALVMGGALFLVGHFFYLVFVFPLLMGLSLGWVGGALIKRSRIRNSFLAFILAVSTAVTAMATVQYLSYMEFRSDISALRESEEAMIAPEIVDSYETESIQEALSSLPEEDREFIDSYVRFIRAAESFPAYLSYEMEDGVELTSATRGKGIELGYAGTITYYLLELAGVMAIAASFMVEQSCSPYCTVCGSWKAHSGLCRMVVTKTSGKKLRAFIQSGELERARKQMDELLPEGEEAKHQETYEAKLHLCAHCMDSAPVDLELLQIKRTFRGEEKEKRALFQTYPGESLKAITSTFSWEESELQE